MTNLLTQPQTDALRSIGDSALVLFAMAMIDGNYPGRATKPEELLPYLHPTYKDRRKLTTQLDALSASGRLAKQGAGYVLLEGGRALVLSMSPAGSINALAQSPALAAGTQAQALVLEVDSVDFSDFEPARALRALKKEEEDSLILKDKESSSSDIAQNAHTDAVEIAPGVTTERILLASSTLDGFGEGVFLQGIDLDAFHPRLALGWLAQAYDEREKLANPAGLVYSRLRNPDKPRPRVKYYEGWESYLPDEFLQLIGWKQIRCASCGKIFEKADDLREHEAKMLLCEHLCGARFHTMAELEKHHAEHRPAKPKYNALPATDRGAKAWELVRAELETYLPKASFETWVKDACAVACDGSVLTLVVRNAYTSDWLTQRLSAKIDAMLKTFTNDNSARVVFVVGTVEEE